MNETFTMTMIIWSSGASIVGTLGLVIGYLIKSKVKTIEKDIVDVKKEQKDSITIQAKDKLHIAENFLLKKDYNAELIKIETTQAEVFRKIDELKNVVNQNHFQVMTEMKVKNGSGK